MMILRRSRNFLRYVQTLWTLATVTEWKCLRLNSLAFPCTLFVKGTRTILHAPDDTEARNCIREVILEDTYGVWNLALTAETPLVVDIGANIGTFSVLARALWPQAHIIAYEPHPIAKHWASINAEESSFVLETVAVSDREYDTTLSATGDTTRATLGASGGYPVSVVPAQSIEPGKVVHLLKLDCEGAEHEILSDDEFLLRVEEIRMEYHGETVAKNDALVARLERTGFRILKYQPHYMSYGLVGILHASRKGAPVSERTQSTLLR